MFVRKTREKKVDEIDTWWIPTTNKISDLHLQNLQNLQNFLSSSIFSDFQIFSDFGIFSDFLDFPLFLDFSLSLDLSLCQLWSTSVLKYSIWLEKIGVLYYYCIENNNFIVKSNGETILYLSNIFKKDLFGFYNPEM